VGVLSGLFPPEGLPAPLRAVLGGLVYLFLLQFLWVLRRDLQRAQAGAQATLTLIEAPQETLEAGLQVGQAFVVTSPATLGRAPGNTVVVPAQTVSLTHLRFVYRNGGWWIEDLGSTNGTFVDGRPVAGITGLARGAIVGCGPQVRFRLHEQ
jgi:pSer/pThr/pTyr-binding forkhead associated (FHA) protein